jgi:hypothetical protein
VSQNTSTAVMQRRAEPHNSLDDFPTPPWATRAMLVHVLKPMETDLSKLTAWEPACNRGYMAHPLMEFFGHVICTDIHDYGWQGQKEVVDFLWPREGNCADWIITNPPFRLAEQFITTGLERASRGVAVLLRVAFLEGVGRYKNLFRDTPPCVVAPYVERVPMLRGRYDPKGTTATAYCWFIWRHGAEGTRLIWIPPSKSKMMRDGDL